MMVIFPQKDRAQFIVPLQKYKSNSDVKKTKKLIKGPSPDR